MNSVANIDDFLSIIQKDFHIIFNIYNNNSLFAALYTHNLQIYLDMLKDISDNKNFHNITNVDDINNYQISELKYELDKEQDYYIEICKNMFIDIIPNISSSFLQTIKNIFPEYIDMISQITIDTQNIEKGSDLHDKNAISDIPNSYNTYTAKYTNHNQSHDPICADINFDMLRHVNSSENVTIFAKSTDNFQRYVSDLDIEERVDIEYSEPMIKFTPELLLDNVYKFTTKLEVILEYYDTNRTSLNDKFTILQNLILRNNIKHISKIYTDIYNMNTSLQNKHTAYKNFFNMNKYLTLLLFISNKTVVAFENDTLVYLLNILFNKISKLNLKAAISITIFELMRFNRYDIGYIADNMISIRISNKDSLINQICNYLFQRIKSNYTTKYEYKTNILDILMTYGSLYWKEKAAKLLGKISKVDENTLIYNNKESAHLVTYNHTISGLIKYNDRINDGKLDTDIIIEEIYHFIPINMLNTILSNIESIINNDTLYTIDSTDHTLLDILCLIWNRMKDGNNNITTKGDTPAENDVGVIYCCIQPTLLSEFYKELGELEDICTTGYVTRLLNILTNIYEDISPIRVDTSSILCNDLNIKVRELCVEHDIYDPEDIKNLVLNKIDILSSDLQSIHTNIQFEEIKNIITKKYKIN